MNSPNYNIQLNTIRFSNLEKKNQKYDIVNIFSDNNKIFLNLPKLKCPFGITKFHNNGIEKYSLNISLDNTDNTYKFLENLDDWVTDNFIEHKQWLDKLNLDIDSTKTQIKQCCNSIINIQENHPAYINLKLIFDKNGVFFCDIFKNSNGKITKINNISEITDLLYKKNLLVSSKIVVSNVWIMDKKYGLTLKPKKIVIYES